MLLTKEEMDDIRRHRAAYDGVTQDLIDHVDELEKLLAARETPDA